MMMMMMMMMMKWVVGSSFVNQWCISRQPQLIPLYYHLDRQLVPEIFISAVFTAHKYQPYQ